MHACGCRFKFESLLEVIIINIIIINQPIYVPLLGTGWEVVPPLAQCGLGTSHIPLNFFADVFRFPHDVVPSPKLEVIFIIIFPVTVCLGL